MQATAALILTAIPSAAGGTVIHISVTLRDPDGGGNGMEKEVRMPATPDLGDPWDWAQTALCAAADGLDDLGDVRTYGIPTQRGGVHDDA